MFKNRVREIKFSELARSRYQQNEKISVKTKTFRRAICVFFENAPAEFINANDFFISNNGETKFILTGRNFGWESADVTTETTVDLEGDQKLWHHARKLYSLVRIGPDEKFENPITGQNGR